MTPCVGKDGKPVCDFDGEPIIKVTNCHWAEFYYGAMVYAKVVVILFDSSLFCVLSCCCLLLCVNII